MQKNFHFIPSSELAYQQLAFSLLSDFANDLFTLGLCGRMRLTSIRLFASASIQDHEFCL